MPNDVKEKVIAKLESIPKEYQVWHNYLPGVINFIKTGTYVSAHWDKFKETIAIHDKYRGQSFANTFPEFAEIAGIKK